MTVNDTPRLDDSDAVWADYYEQHRELDTDAEEVPVDPRMPPFRRGLVATITVRFPAEEAASIRALAKESGLSYSDVIRRAVDAYARPRLTLNYGTPNGSVFYTAPQTIVGNGDLVVVTAVQPRQAGGRTALAGRR